MKTYLKVRLVAAMFLIAGCSGGGGGSSPEQPLPPTGTTAEITLLLKDAPVDSVTEVWVEFTAVELKPAGEDGEEGEDSETGEGEEGDSPTVLIEFEEPMQIDLLTLTGGESATLLNNETIEAGDYNWIRLDVNADEDGVFDSYVMTDSGEMIELEVTSQQGLRMVSGFSVEAGGDVAFMVDWDLRKGLNIPKNPGRESWRLKPTLRIVSLDEEGTLSGSVDATLLNDESCTNDLAEDTGNAIYVFAGADAVPEDMHTEETDPIATVDVKQDENGLYVYSLDFLEPGDYTAAFTCQALDDDPETDDDVAFAEEANVTVVDGEETIQDFGI